MTVPFGSDTEEDHRLFTSDLDQVMKLPDSSFGVVMTTNTLVKESSYTKLSRIPKKYASFGSFDSVWQLDYLATAANTLKTEHLQSVFGVKNRKAFRIYPVNTPKQILLNYRLRDNREATEHFAICSSLLEDYNLNQFWHVDITDSVTIATYAREQEVKAFLDIRTDPLTQTGQRKRVLHWVSGHRRIIGGESVPVARHMRGMEKFEIGGFNVAITQPQKQSNK